MKPMLWSRVTTLFSRRRKHLANPNAFPTLERHLRACQAEYGVARMAYSVGDATWNEPRTRLIATITVSWQPDS